MNTADLPDRPQRIRAHLRAWWPDLLIFAVLASVFVVLGVRHARSNSATFDEVAHLPAGYSYLTFGDYRLSPSHPPLAKMLGALPWLGTAPWPSQRDLRSDHGNTNDLQAIGDLARLWDLAATRNEAEFPFGKTLLFGMRDSALARRNASSSAIPSTFRYSVGDFVNDGPHLIFLGRLPIIGLGLFLLLLIYAWAHDLGGRPGAVIATSLAALDPNLIAHGSLVTTDMGFTVFLFGAIFAARLIMRRAERRPTILLGVFVALASATKFSAALLLPILATIGVLWIAAPVTGLPTGETRGQRLAVLSRATILAMLLTYGGLWAAYGFRFAMVTEGETVPTPAARADQMRGFVTLHAALARVAAEQTDDAIPMAAVKAAMANTPLPASSRFLLWAHEHRVFPEAMLIGLASVQPITVRRLSYFEGRITTRGSLGFFPMSFLLKTPEITLLLILIALVLCVRGNAISWIDAICLLVPPIWLMGTAMRTPVNLGFRHILPIVPMLITLTAVVGSRWPRLPRRAQLITTPLALGALILSTQFVRTATGELQVLSPHQLTYFNRLSPGPDLAHRVFVDSNLDWGQALPTLRDWLDEQTDPSAPILLCYFGTSDPRAYGIPFRSLPGCGDGEGASDPWVRHAASGAVTIPTLSPGQIVAVSATYLAGLYRAPDQHAALMEFLARRTKPIGTAGHAIHLFRVTDASP